MTKPGMHAVYIIAAAAVIGLAAPDREAAAQLGLPTVPGGLRDLPVDVDRRVQSRAERAAEEAAEEAARARETAGETAATAGDAAAGNVATLADHASGIVDGVTRSFIATAAPDGSLVEADIVVALVDDLQRDAMLRAGAVIVSERAMGALGKTLVTMRRPDGVALDVAVRQLRSSFPDTPIDYNHLYRFDHAGSADATDAAGAPRMPGADAAEARDGQRPLRVGVIDSAVLATHPALAEVRVIDRDFVVSEHPRPLTHGTAVASLIAAGANADVDVYSASVFFQVPGHMPGASTEGLVAALDWLVAEDVDVVNMSLSGPSNELLKAAVDATAERGKIIVAAVGNNGPAGEPLYPGAYESVIAVTAVDRDQRVFRNANRGAHVDYAALGVNVKVADSTTGTFTIASGTSMAAPRVAVIIATILRETAADREALTSWLIASAKDLGRRGFDPVYGHGLITQPPLVVSDN